MLARANEEETGMATIFGTAPEEVGKLNDKLDAASAKIARQIPSSEAVNLQQVSHNVLLSAAKVNETSQIAEMSGTRPKSSQTSQPPTELTSQNAVLVAANKQKTGMLANTVAVCQNNADKSTTLVEASARSHRRSQTS